MDDSTDDGRPSADRDAMYAAFELHPGDLAGYGAMADELDVLGYSSTAHAFRWMCFRGVWPHKRTHYVNRYSQRKVPKSYVWAWYAPYWDAKNLTATVPDLLPTSKWVYHALPHLLISGDQKVFRTHQIAVMYLANSLRLLRDVYSVSPLMKATV